MDVLGTTGPPSPEICLLRRSRKASWRRQTVSELLLDWWTVGGGAGLWGEAPRMRRRATVRAPGPSLPLSLCPASMRTPEGRGRSESFLGP